MKKQDIIIAELSAELRRCFGRRLAQILLFGSRARGDAKADSDYDVLVILRGEVNPQAERRRAGDLVYRLCWKHDAVILCHFVPINRYEQEHSPFMLNVHREGVAV